MCRGVFVNYSLAKCCFAKLAEDDATSSRGGLPCPAWQCRLYTNGRFRQWRPSQDAHDRPFCHSERAKRRGIFVLKISSNQYFVININHICDLWYFLEESTIDPGTCECPRTPLACLRSTIASICAWSTTSCLTRQTGVYPIIFSPTMGIIPLVWRNKNCTEK